MSPDDFLSNSWLSFHLSFESEWNFSFQWHDELSGPVIGLNIFQPCKPSKAFSFWYSIWKEAKLHVDYCQLTGLPGYLGSN